MDITEVFVLENRMIELTYNTNYQKNYISSNIKNKSKKYLKYEIKTRFSPLLNVRGFN